MKTVIISYSFTGNNKVLASHLAKAIGADHIQIEDKRNVTVKSIMLDLIFHRRAKNVQRPSIINKYDFVIYLAPFWVGKIARPILPFLRHQRKHPKQYAFITVSGGALGKNEKFHNELFKRAKAKPVFTHAFYTSDLVNKEDVSMKKTSTYIINKDEALNMINVIKPSLSKQSLISQ